MGDLVSKEGRSKIMQAVKPKNTKLENLILKELWKRGIRYRRNVKELPGKPDMAIKKYKLVVFIDSCFWHGCPYHCRMPVTNHDYWTNKIMKNKNRDLEITGYYTSIGWEILRFWEHDIKDDHLKIVDVIVDSIEKHKSEVNS